MRQRHPTLDLRRLRRLRRLRWLPVLAAAILAASCGGGGGGSGDAESGVAVATSARGGSDRNSGSSASTARPVTPVTPAPDTVLASNEGRLLASNCFQCHGTGGTGGFDNIRGSEADEVLEFLTDNPSSNIMAAHAQGYTRAQLQKIIAYLQQP